MRIGVSISTNPSPSRCSRIMRTICARIASILRHLGTAQVEVAVTQPQVLGSLDAILDRERWRLGCDSAPRACRRSPRSRRSRAGVDACPRGERPTEPVIRTTSSAPRRCAVACASAASSGWNTTCTAPSRSRRSMKVTPPWSRRRATQPQSDDGGSGVAQPQLAARVGAHRGPHGRSRVRCHVASSGRCEGQSSSLVSQRATSPRGTSFCTPSTRRRSVTTPSAISRSPMIADERGAGAVRHLELRLQRPFLERLRRRDTGDPKLVDERRAASRAPSPIATTKQLGVARRRRGETLAFHREQYPVQAHREARPPASAGRRAPRRGRRSGRRRIHRAALFAAEHARDPLERRARVVVESAHQPRVELVRDPGRVQALANRGEVLGARLAQVIGDRRRGQHEVLVAVDLAVEDAQRVRLADGSRQSSSSWSR